MNRLNYNKITVLSFAIFLAVMLVVVSAPLGSRLGFWSFDDAIKLLKVAAAFGMIAVILSLLGAYQARPGQHCRGFYLSLMVVIIFTPTLLFLVHWNNAKETMPAIQDISTNTKSPPEFWTAPNSRVYGGAWVAVFQERAYPEIKPLFVSNSVEAVFDAALRVIKQKSWQLWQANRLEKHIEATETTYWFGFSDDIVIHISRTETGKSRVDVRSTSRFGSGGDGGTNARRILSFMKALKRQL